MSWLDKVVNLAVQSAGSLIGTRPTVNFTGASVTVTDDSANNRVNVAIASSSAPDATTTTKGIVQLAGDIAGTATSVTVAKVNGVSVSGTPTAGQVITASSGTAAAWATTVSVGPYSSRPTASSGSIYFPTDGWCNYVGDGSTWRPIIGGVAGTQPPAANTFTALNMSATSTLTDSNGALIANDDTPSSAIPNYHVWHASLGAATNVEACIIATPNLTNWTGGSMCFPFGGICLRESSTGKIACLYWYYTPNLVANLSFEYSTSVTGTRAIVNNCSFMLFSAHVANLFLRLRVSGGNLIAEYSGGRGNFFNVGTISLTTVFTTAPDQYGLTVWPYNNNNPSSARIVVPHLATY